MSYKIIVRPEAQADLLVVCRWYEDRSEGLGREFFRRPSLTLFNAIRKHIKKFIKTFGGFLSVAFRMVFSM